MTNIRKLIIIALAIFVSSLCLAESDKHFNKKEFIKNLKSEIVERDNGDVVIPFFEKVELENAELLDSRGNRPKLGSSHAIPYNILKYFKEDPVLLLRPHFDYSGILDNFPEYFDDKGDMYYCKYWAREVKTTKKYFESLKNGLPIIFSLEAEEDFLIERAKERSKVEIRDWRPLLRKNLIKEIPERTVRHSWGIIYGFNPDTKELLCRYASSNKKQTFFLAIHESEMSKLCGLVKFVEFDYKPKDNKEDNKNKKSKKEKKRTFRH